MDKEAMVSAHWGRLTIGGMIMTPMTSHHMMHLPTVVDRIIEKESRESFWIIYERKEGTVT